MATNAHLTTQSPPTKYNLRRDLIAAIETGQLAGLIMAVAIIAVFALVLRTPWYHPVQVIGSVVVGERAVAGNFLLPAFLAGLLVHQLVALGWSVFFAFMINKVQHTWGNVLAVGLATGVLAQLLGRAVIVPLAMTALQGRNLWAENVPGGWSWVAHLVFGLSFLLFVPLWARAPKGPMARSVDEGVAHGRR